MSKNLVLVLKNAYTGNVERQIIINTDKSYTELTDLINDFFDILSGNNKHDYPGSTVDPYEVINWLKEYYKLDINTDKPDVIERFY